MVKENKKMKHNTNSYPTFHICFGICEALNTLIDKWNWAEEDGVKTIEIEKHEVENLIKLLKPVQEYINGKGTRE